MQARSGARSRTIQRSPFADLIVLGLLSEAPLHGYALFARIRDELAGVWRINMNRLYALLGEMDCRGLVQGHPERAGNRPPRNVYRPTVKGRRQFQAWMRTPSRTMRDMRIEFPPKLYFALRRSHQEAANLIALQRAACYAELERLTTQQMTAKPDSYRWLICDFRLRQVRAILEWLEMCRAHPLIAAEQTARGERIEQ
jgi:DNA-binding PadR family transcriptional regulator